MRDGECYKGVMIVGYDNNGAFNAESIELYRKAEADGYLVIGSRERGFDLDEIRAELDGKIDENTRIDIIAHGNINKDKNHFLRLNQEQTGTTKEVLEAINACSGTSKHIHLNSCYGGAAAKDIEVLTPRSFLACHASDDTSRVGVMPAELTKRLIDGQAQNIASMLFKTFSYDLGNDAIFSYKNEAGEVKVSRCTDIVMEDISSTDSRFEYARKGFLKIFNDLGGSDLPPRVITEEQRRILEGYRNVEEFIELFGHKETDGRQIFNEAAQSIIDSRVEYLLGRENALVLLENMPKEYLTAKLINIALIQFRRSHIKYEVMEKLLTMIDPKEVTSDHLALALRSGNPEIIRGVLDMIDDREISVDHLREINGRDEDLVREILSRIDKSELTAQHLNFAILQVVRDGPDLALQLFDRIDHNKITAGIAVQAIKSGDIELARKALAYIDKLEVEGNPQLSKEQVVNLADGLSVEELRMLREKKLFSKVTFADAIYLALDTRKSDTALKLIAMTTGDDDLNMRFLGTNTTALMMAAEGGQTEIARLLIDKGAKLDLDNGTGQTALMMAAERGQTEIARLLIDKGAKLDLADKDGNTALMVAARNGHLEVAKAIKEEQNTGDIMAELQQINAKEFGENDPALIAMITGAFRANNILIDENNKKQMDAIRQISAHLKNPTEDGFLDKLKILVTKVCYRLSSKKIYTAPTLKLIKEEMRKVIRSQPPQRGGLSLTMPSRDVIRSQPRRVGLTVTMPRGI